MEPATIWFITWVEVGKVPLTAGKHTIVFRMDSGPQNHAAIDCAEGRRDFHQYQFVYVQHQIGRMSQLGPGTPGSSFWRAPNEIGAHPFAAYC